MKISEILAEKQDLKAINIHRLADMVEKAIKNDRDSDYTVDVSFAPNNSAFPDMEIATFVVDFVNSRKGGDQPGQNTSKKLNKIIDPLYREFRAQGITFTQPEGVQGSNQESDDLTTGKLKFVIGVKKD